MIGLENLLRPAIKKVLLARVIYLVDRGRLSEAKAQIIWGHSFDYLDEDETAELIHDHGLASV